MIILFTAIIVVIILFTAIIAYVIDGLGTRLRDKSNWCNMYAVDSSSFLVSSSTIAFTSAVSFEGLPDPDRRHIDFV